MILLHVSNTILLSAMILPNHLPSAVICSIFRHLSIADLHLFRASGMECLSSGRSPLPIRASPLKSVLDCRIRQNLSKSRNFLVSFLVPKYISPAPSLVPRLSADHLPSAALTIDTEGIDSLHCRYHEVCSLMQAFEPQSRLSEISRR
jgi:hypothetical protein